MERVCPYCEERIDGSSSHHCDHHNWGLLNSSFSSSREVEHSLSSHSDYAGSEESDDELPSTNSYLALYTDPLSLLSAQPRQSKSRQRRLTPIEQPAKLGCHANCPVCLSSYSADAHAPLVLPSCGHTVCRPCLQSLVKFSSVSKCPVCKQLNFTEVDSLPTNYALLEYAGLKAENDRCDTHKLELVAYCCDDDLLLCGACIFEHRAHTSFLLTDERALGKAQERKAQLVEEEAKLLAIKDNWQRAVQEMSQEYAVLNDTAKKHIQAFEAAGQEMIATVKAGTQACIAQIRKLVKDEEVRSQQQEMANTISKLNQQLARLQDHQRRFESLTMVEKLAPVVDAELLAVPPEYEVGQVVNFNVPVDYEAAIERHQLDLS